MKTFSFYSLITQIVTCPRPAPPRLVVAALLVLIAAASGSAQITNGNFSNGGTGWTKTGTGAAAPRVGSSEVFIGTNSAAGVPGDPQGCVEQMQFFCSVPSTTDTCAQVTFACTFNQAPGETAICSLDSPVGSYCGVIPPGGPMTESICLPNSCQYPCAVCFAVVPAMPGQHVNSLLTISSVSGTCSPSIVNTMAPYQPPSDIESAAWRVLPPRAPMSPLPLTAGGEWFFPPGWTPFTIPVVSSGNGLDTVLPAANGSKLIIYNAQNLVSSFERSGSIWMPTGGVLQAGSAAFFDNPLTTTQSFTFSGITVATPVTMHPYIGAYEYAGNPLPGPATFKQVFGTDPVVGDQYTTFAHGAGSPAEPSQIYTFTPTTILFPPMIPAFETVGCYWSPPSDELQIQPGANFGGFPGFAITTPGGLPDDGTVQENTMLGTGTLTLYTNSYTNLYGVYGYYAPQPFPAAVSNSEPSVPQYVWYRNLATQGSNQFQFTLTLIDTNRNPIPGVTVQEAPNGPVSTTDTNGQATFTLAEGTTYLDVDQLLTTGNGMPTNSGALSVLVDVVIRSNSPPQNSATLQVSPDMAMAIDDILISNSCTCTPWAAVMGGTINGVQTVIAAGGYGGKGCMLFGSTPSVMITGPGINIMVEPAPKVRYKFSPAADGTYTVTSTVCDKTRTATITLP